MDYREAYEKLLYTMEQFAACNLTDDNCASLEVANRRIRNLARLAIESSRPEAADSVPNAYKTS